MTEQTAVPQAHSSLVGGSTAARRIGCAGSWSREQKAPKSKGSAYARGTALHELVAHILLSDDNVEDLLPFTHKQPAKGVEEAWELTITQEIWDLLGAPALQAFDDFMDDLEADTGEYMTYMIEQSGEFPRIPGAFGTSDVAFRCGPVGGIWDWKFGRNEVKSHENKQLMFYFAALRHKHPTFFDGVDEIELIISQPQVSDEPNIWSTTHGRIDEFEQELVDAVARMKEDDAPIAKGPWCDFADCKAVCELHVGAAAELGKMVNAIKNHDPEKSTIDFETYLSDAMELAEAAAAWAKHIAGITQERLEAGAPVEGWKVVEKASRGREWLADETVVVRRLRSRGLKSADIYTKKVISAPQAEKALKALGRKLDKKLSLPQDIVGMKPSNGYTLTRDGDPRERAVTKPEKAKALGSALLAQLKENK